MNPDTAKKAIKPSKRKLLGAAGVFAGLNFLTAPANIFYTFQQGLAAPLPYYVWSTCTSMNGGCPEVATGLRQPSLGFNILFCYISGSALVHWRGEAN